MRKALITSVAILALALGASTAALAGGPHDKATGTVTWSTPLQGWTAQSSFDAHDGAPGDQPDRGTVTTSIEAVASTVTVELDCVDVSGDQARMTGTAVDAQGSQWAVGDTIHFWVADGGKDGDRFNMWNNASLGACSWDGSPGGPVTAGNLTVFSSTG